MTVKQIVQTLELQPHPEGGFYREVYRSNGTLDQNCLNDNFSGKRNYSTSIYYLLERGDFSAFHRISSDEIWHHYLGGDLLIHSLDKNGNYTRHVLGSAIGDGAVLQVVIPARHWFASEPAPGTEFILAGCTVSPGFDFQDFELADKTTLLKQFPDQAELIRRLCR